MRSLTSNPVAREQVTLSHGSPREPLWEYILNTVSARANFDHFTTPFCFVGHSHIQCLFKLTEGSDQVSLSQPQPDQPIKMTQRMILNPGSVGQPRDRDPRAAYAIYETDSQSWTPKRVSYDIPSVQKRIRESGLPEKHALRLSDGW